MLRYEPQKGVVSCDSKTAGALLELRLELETAEAAGPLSLSLGDDGWLRGRLGSLTVELSLSQAGAGFGELRFRLIPSRPVRVERVGFALHFPDASSSLLSRETRLVPLFESLTTARRVRELGAALDAAQGKLALHAIGVALNDRARTLIVGIGGHTPDFPVFTTDLNQTALSFGLERTISRPVQYSVLVGASDDPHGLLETYGDLLARGGSRVGEVPTGWNSWDYYQGGITLDAIVEELVAINASRLRGLLKYACVDMGWETCWGDWRPSRKFPQDPAEMASAIRAQGFEPGIWLAPLQANTYLPVARHQRDMFLRDADGEPIVMAGDGSCLLFDPTHPWTEQWLYDLCSGLRKAGFSLFKIDYIYRDYLNPIVGCHDSQVGKAQAARRFLEIIRSAIGDDAHLISCGVPPPASFGLADSARVSTDIHNFWGHVRNSAIQVSQAYWLSGRMWTNDPDFALIRSAQTSDDPYLNPAYKKQPFDDGDGFWMAGEDATYAELKTWLTLVHLCGGSLFASDSIARLNGLGLDILTRLFQQPGPPARPLDLFDAVLPSVYLSDSALGIVNFSDDETEIELPASAPTSGMDFWTGEKLSLGSSVRLPGHQSLLMRL